MLNFYSFLAIVRNTISFKLRNKWDNNCCVIWNNLMSNVDTVLSGLNRKFKHVLIILISSQVKTRASMLFHHHTSERIDYCQKLVTSNLCVKISLVHRQQRVCIPWRNHPHPVQVVTRVPNTIGSNNSNHLKYFPVVSVFFTLFTFL